MKKRNAHHGNSRRQQAPKLGGNREMMRAMQELRRSSATSPIPSGKAYRRPSPGKRWE